MSLLWFEFTLAIRRLWRRPVQSWLMLATFAISLTLALLSWSLFYTVFEYNPGFDPHGQLCVVTYYTSGGNHAAASAHPTEREFEAFSEGQTDFADFAEMAFYDSVFLSTPHGIERVLGAHVSSGAFRLVGAKPALGRLFVPAEDKLGGPLSVILSHHVWETYFAADPDIVGKVTQINGDPRTIVGVMPADFRFPNDQDAWLTTSSIFNSDYFPIRDALARLKPGITPRRAELDLQVILSRLGPGTRANQMHFRPVVLPFREFYLLNQVRVSALVLFSLAMLFVVVGCVNAANLMLIDFLGRQSEVAAALALGIPKRAAIRGICFQVAVLTAMAALLSLGCLILVAPALHRGLMVVNVPYWLRFSLGAHHLWMAGVLAAASCAMALVAPISYLLWIKPDRIVREHMSASRGAGRGRARRLLLTGQIAILTVLGVCAGLLVHSSFHLSDSRWNYDARRIFLGSVSTRGASYADKTLSTRDGRYAAFRRVLDGVSQVPGISGAAFMWKPLGYGTPPDIGYAADPGAATSLGYAVSTGITDKFFDTIGVPFIAGTTFPQATAPSGFTYTVINASLAARLWPGEDPLRRAIYVRYPGMDPKAPPVRLLVVGVVRDFQASGPMSPVNDCMYIPFDSSWEAPNTAYLLASGDPVPTLETISRTVHSIDPRLSLFFTSTVGQQIELMLSPVRLTTRLTIIFALAAVLLCAVGVYSLTVSQVLQSSREFGIRMALGAEPHVLWRHFVRGHFLDALAGVALGLIAAFQVARLLRGLLVGVDSHSAEAFLGVAVVILAVTVLACVPSLFRLQRINPADCLRSL